MRIVTTPPVETRGDNTIVVFLSLYLLLLAFFILLNSISQFEEERTKRAIGSLTATFAPSDLDDPDTTPLNSLEGQFLDPEAFQGHLAKLVKTAVELSRVEIVVPGRLMRVAVPEDALFVPGEARFKPQAASLLEGVAGALARTPPGLRYETEVVTGARWIPADDLAGGETLSVARAGAFARELETRGAPGGTVGVGLDHGPEGEVRFTFLTRGEDEPRIDFHRLAR